jgi:hypothetical protein
MSIEQLFWPALATLIGVVAAMQLLYWSARTGHRVLRQLAVIVALAPPLGFGARFAWQELGLNRPPEFRTSTPGPAGRSPSVTREFPFPVNASGVLHELVLLPRLRGDQLPPGNAHLRFVVRSPKREIVAEGEQDLVPQGLGWAAVLKEFQPNETGEHSLTIDIPNPVDVLDVIVREARE